MEERHAINRLKRGDIGGLEHLVRTYQVQAECAVYVIVRDHTLAEDIVQAAFLRVYDRIDQFDETHAFGPRFFRSVINDAIKCATRRERHVSLEQLIRGETVVPPPSVAAEELGPAHRVEQAETRQEVWAALGRLSPKHRAVIVRRYYLEMSEADMADDLHCPPGTIKSRLATAREQMRRWLLPLWRGEARGSAGEGEIESD